jgi:hypothetical protein
MNRLSKISLIVLLLISSIIATYRINIIHNKEISWDILGYYLYLPATFIHHDPMLKDISWLKELNEKEKLAGTLYMVSSNDKGEPMYFFLMGMAMFYLPFFLLGHGFAQCFGFPVDGFSPPYTYFLVFGAIIYTIIGLIYFRKILLSYFSEKLTALLLLIVVFGTNYINHLTIDDLATTNILFMLTAITLWNTIQWHKTEKRKNLIAIGIAGTLITLVKPSEIIVFIIPLFWNITSSKQISEKLWLFKKHWKPLVITFAICLLLFLPQLLYWHHKTGQFIYDSYKNPGIGLDFLSPHIVDVLFSYRKGWLLYTPIMGFGLLGFFFMYKANKPIFWASIIYFCTSFYIISSWTEWWYGASFSIRPLISTYPILALAFGYFLQSIRKEGFIIKAFISVLLLCFIALNQFQWWQYRHYILDPYRTTKAYYWATFLKTKLSGPEKTLLSVYRDFSGSYNFTDKENYQNIVLLNENFQDTLGQTYCSEGENRFVHLSKEQEFYPIFELPYKELCSQDHFWVKAKVEIRFSKIANEQQPCLVLTMERNTGTYGYRAVDLKSDTLANSWTTFETFYLTPEIRSKSDRFKCYIWNRGKCDFDIDNIKIEIYKRKQEY